MTADVVWSEGAFRITNVGCGFTRRVLSSLEPGARLWLTVEGQPIRFEKQENNTDGPELVPLAGGLELWRNATQDGRYQLLEFDFDGQPGVRVPGRWE